MPSKILSDVFPCRLTCRTAPSGRHRARSAYATCLALLLLLTFAYPAIGGELDQVRQRGSLRMITMPQQNSFFARVDVDALRERGVSLADLHDADLFSGTDVEIMKRFAAKLGVDLEIVAVTKSWSDLLPTLLDEQGDVVAASLTITPERREIVDFSEPYMESFVVAAVPRARLDEFRTEEDLTGATVAVMRGSSQLEIVSAREDLGLELLLTDYAVESQAAVTEGNADLMLLDSAASVGENPEPAYPDMAIAQRLGSFQNAFALRPGSDLIEPLDRFLQEIRNSGELDEIFAAENVLGVVTTPAGRSSVQNSD